MVKHYPSLKHTARIKKLPNACWVVDVSSDNGIYIHPQEAFILSLCNGNYDIDTIKYIYANTLRKEISEMSGLIDSTLDKLAKYIVWQQPQSARKHGYEPREFLYEQKPGRFGVSDRSDTPGEMNLILTHACNFKCIYCFNSSGGEKSTALSTEEWLDVIEQAKKMQVVKYTISGGEPLVHPGIFDILTKVTEGNSSVYLCTNGSLIDESAVNKFKELGLPCIQLSLDAATAHAHDNIVAVPDTFDKVINAIRMLVAAGIEVYIKSVITPLNLGEVEALIDLCHQLGVKRLTLDRFDLSNSGRGDQKLFMSQEQEGQLADVIQRKQKDITRDMEVTAVTSTRCWSSKDNIIRCGALKNSMTILPTGDITVCEKVIDVPELLVGNVRESTLMDIWCSKKVENIISPSEEKIEEPCKSCEHLRDCGTGCYALTLFVSSNPYDVDPRCWKSNYANSPYNSYLKKEAITNVL